jgi:hypothetical protein
LGPSYLYEIRNRYRAGRGVHCPCRRCLGDGDLFLELAHFAAAIAAGLIVGFLIKVFSELVRVIVDMLLPMPN